MSQIRFNYVHEYKLNYDQYLCKTGKYCYIKLIKTKLKIIRLLIFNTIYYIYININSNIYGNE